VGDEELWTVLREAGYEPTDESRAQARARLDQTVPPERRAESRERLREILGWT
jgi:hypothetical protein